MATTVQSARTTDIGSSFRSSRLIRKILKAILGERPGLLKVFPGRYVPVSTCRSIRLMRVVTTFRGLPVWATFLLYFQNEKVVEVRARVSPEKISSFRITFPRGEMVIQVVQPQHSAREAE